MALIAAAPLSRADEPDSTITVEATRQRALRHQVDAFVTHALVKVHNGDSLMRWDHPVCPLAAGLPREAGEFLLRRISEIAESVHAPLGKTDCRPNFYVIVTDKPEVFLKLWWRRSPLLFETSHGIAPARRFIETPRPIRVWRNANDIDAQSGVAFGEMLSETAGLGLGTLDYPTIAHPSSLGSRLTHAVVRNIRSIIVIVNHDDVLSLSLGQLADYITLVGLAEVNEASNLSAPSLLQLFKVPDVQRPTELTAWDRALLRGLYATPQKDAMQLAEIETYALKDIVANSVP